MLFPFNKGQLNAIGLSKDWYLSYEKTKKMVFEISGPAGSGKTSIIYGLVEELKLDIKRDVIFMALIGQAASVMRMKGLDANTIHGSIYQVYDTNVADTDGKPIMDRFGRPLKKTGWSRRQKLENTNAKLIVVDEGSMVDSKIRADILAFNVPVIVLGDLDQLPPIYGESAFLKNPDVILTEIERQSKDHPIISLSVKARLGEPIELGTYGPNSEVKVITQDELTDEMLTDADIVICGKNKTRNVLNDRIRKALGFSGNLPNIGERIVFRKNDWAIKLDNILAITNGLQGYVLTRPDLSEMAETGNFIIDVKPVTPCTTYFMGLEIDYEYFSQGCTSEKTINPYNQGQKIEYGYAITCHMSQGSQYNKVLIYEEILNRELHKKWMYTAITRGIDEVIIVKPNPPKKKALPSGKSTYTKRRW